MGILCPDAPLGNRVKSVRWRRYHGCPAMPKPPLDQLRAFLLAGDHRPILWLGAGASCQADPPLPTLWSIIGTLTRDFAAHWEPPKTDDTYAIIDDFVREVGEGELHRALERELRPGGKAPSPGALHRHLAKLVAAGCFSLVIDTNYDLLLRRACDDLGASLRFSQLDRNLHLPDDGHTRYLALHGMMDDWRSVVLTGRSYAEFDQRHPLAVHELALRLRQHRVLFVGCSLQDPRLASWMTGLDADERRRLHMWRAVMGPGEAAKLEQGRWTDGRTYAQVLEHIRCLDLPDFATLPRWFEQLASEVEGPEQALDVLIHAGARWVVEAAGERVEIEPPAITPIELATLRSVASHGLACERDGSLPAAARASLDLLDAQVRSVGERLAKVLPAKAMERLARMVGAAATREAGTLHLRVEGEPHEVDEVMLLPWEMLAVDGRPPVRDGALHLVREVVVAGAEGLPNDVTTPRVLAHVAAPEGEGVVELDLEAASYRIARALDPLRDFVRFTELGTLDDLERAAKALGHTTILHFSGHGSPEGLWFEDERGGPQQVSVGTLCDRFAAAGTRLPAAVWLSCCYGAGKGMAAKPGVREWGSVPTGDRSPSLAAALHRRGIPQVLGYFGPVDDALAARVDRDLFAALVDTGRTVEAVKRARVQSKQPIDGGLGWAMFPLAWSMLALYHRGPDRKLLDPKSLTKTENRRAHKWLAPERIEIQGARNLPVLQHGFVGRRRVLAELRRRQELGTRLLGLLGLGGLGKTATMIRLAIVLVGADKTKQQVIALPIGDRRSSSVVPSQPFAYLAALVHETVAQHPRRPDDWDARMQAIDELVQPEARADALARALLLAARGGVLYLDNLETLQVHASGDDPAAWREPALTRFFTTLEREVDADTVILMTSRCKPHDTQGEWISLPPAGKGEIFRMTAWWDPMRRLPTVLREALAERIDGHPLTVEWLNGLLAEGITEAIDPDADPGMLERNVIEPAFGKLGAKYESVLVLDELIGRLAAPEQALLGECAAARLPVSREVLDQLGQGAQRVVDLGLITRFGSDGWGLHSLVRERVLAKGLTWTPAGRAVLGEYRRSGVGEEQRFEGLQEAIDHFVAAGRFEDASRVMVEVSNTMQQMGLVRGRFELLAALEPAGWPDAQLGIWSHHYGIAALDIGDLALAERLARAACDMVTKLRGTHDDPHVASSFHGLANVLSRQGRYAEAESIFRDCLTAQGQGHVDIAATLASLANVLARQGKFDESATLFQQSIDILAATHQTREHLSVASSLHGLANVLECQGMHDEAENLYRESIEIKIKAYGTRVRQEVVTSRHGLANALVNRHDYVGAEAVFRENIEILKGIYRTDVHADIASSLCGLANSLERQGRYAEAETVYQESIAAKVKAYTTCQHTEIAASLHGLGHALEGQGKHTEAMHAWKLAIQIEEAVFGSRCTVGAIPSLAMLSQVLLELDQPAEAVKWSGDAWRGATSGGHVSHIAHVGPIHMQCLAANQRIEEIPEVLRQVMDVLQRFPPGHPIRMSVEAKLRAMPK